MFTFRFLVNLTIKLLQWAVQPSRADRATGTNKLDWVKWASLSDTLAAYFSNHHNLLVPFKYAKDMLMNSSCTIH